jgi:glycosyltransferase involved in cell wall biosynthesis
MRIACMVGTDQGWCYETTAREIAKRSRHEIEIVCTYGRDLPADFDLLWLRGYAHLYARHIELHNLNRPLVWQFTTGGDMFAERFERNRAHFPATSICLSQNDHTAQLLRDGGMPRVMVIPNGVDCERFHPAESLPEDFVVGMAANVSGARWSGKGADILTEAARRVPFPLMLATNPTGGRPLFPLYDIGRVQHGDIPAWYRSLSVYCQPSLSEGCSNSIFEAMACGLPVITCRSAGYHGTACRDGLCEDGGEVVFIEPGDIDALCANIEWLRDNPAEAARIGANARAFAMRHQWQYIAAQFDEAFDIAAASHTKHAKARRHGQKFVEFDIVTVCTSAFLPCLRLTLPSWLTNSGAAGVVVVSDVSAPDWLPVGVEWIADPTLAAADWIEGVQARAKALCKLAAKSIDGLRLVVMDADCVVVRPLFELAAGHADLTLNRFSDQSGDDALHRTCAIGMMALAVNERTRRWLDCWLALQTAYAQAGHGTRPGKVACDQLAATDLARGRACGVTVRNVPVEVWNHNNNIGEADAAWLARIAADCPCVLHFKGGKWQDETLFAAAIAAATESPQPKPAARPPQSRGLHWENGRLIRN